MLRSLFIEYAAKAAVTLHSAKTSFVAAHAALNFLLFAAERLLRPARVGDQLAAHRGKLYSFGGKLLIHKGWVGQSADAAQWQVGVLANQIAVL